MKGISYRLSGTPHNLSDCIDILDKHPNTDVDLTLQSSEYISSECVDTHFIATFELRLQEKVLTFEKICGGYSYFVSIDRQRKAIQKANRKLEQMITQIEETSTEVDGKEQRFACPPMGGH